MQKSEKNITTDPHNNNNKLTSNVTQNVEVSKQKKWEIRCVQEDNCC